MRLLNVALTRARDKLVIVAHMEYQLREAPAHYIMPQILSIARLKQVVRSIKNDRFTGNEGR